MPNQPKLILNHLVMPTTTLLLFVYFISQQKKLVRHCAANVTWIGIFRRIVICAAYIRAYMYTHTHSHTRTHTKCVCMHVYFLFVALLPTCCFALSGFVLERNFIPLVSLKTMRWPMRYAAGYCYFWCWLLLLLIFLHVFVVSNIQFVVLNILPIYSTLRRAFVVSFSISYKHIKIHKWICIFCITHFICCVLVVVCFFIYFNDFCFLYSFIGDVYDNFAGPTDIFTYTTTWTNLVKICICMCVCVCMYVCLELV